MTYSAREFFYDDSFLDYTSYIQVKLRNGRRGVVLESRYRKKEYPIGLEAWDLNLGWIFKDKQCTVMTAKCNIVEKDWNEIKVLGYGKIWTKFE
jgi:hypothetical protein